MISDSNTALIQLVSDYYYMKNGDIQTFLNQTENVFEVELVTNTVIIL